jgi:S1-C subfamily serine protease
MMKKTFIHVSITVWCVLHLTQFSALGQDSEAVEFYNLSHRYGEQGDYDNKIALLNEAVRIDPSFALAWNNLADIAVNCPDPQYRNGTLAVRFGLNAVKAFTDNPQQRGGSAGDLATIISNTMAEAYAEAGDFDQAAYWAMKCLQTPRITQNQAAEVRTQLELYKLKRDAAASTLPQHPSDKTTPPAAAKNESASGTAFFITPDGYLVTCAHVVKGATKFSLSLDRLTEVKLVRVDEANDLAVLKAEGNFTALPIATSLNVRLGIPVATVGFPNTALQGLSPKFSKGEIAALTGVQDDPKLFQISVPVQPGNSGGALVDMRGNVIGVVSAKLSARASVATTGTLPENVNYAVKGSYLLSFLESVPAIGAQLQEPTKQELSAENIAALIQNASVRIIATSSP